MFRFDVEADQEEVTIPELPHSDPTQDFVSDAIAMLVRNSICASLENFWENLAVSQHSHCH